VCTLFPLRKFGAPKSYKTPGRGKIGSDGLRISEETAQLISSMDDESAKNSGSVDQITVLLFAAQAPSHIAVVRLERRSGLRSRWFASCWYFLAGQILW